MITVIDYGMSNLRSVVKCFERMGVYTFVAKSPADIVKAKKLVLPGVGHFAKAINNLSERGILDVLNQKVIDDGTPILGICLGMQLFSKWSEEGNVEGLGWIDAQVLRFDPKAMDTARKIPHMGWNNLYKTKHCPILDNVLENDTFYFVHSYFVQCNNDQDVVAKTEYGFEFTSAIQRGNIYGTQFHPEKSHGQGLKILEMFANLNGENLGH